MARQFGLVKMQLQWWTLEYQRFNKDGWWEQRFGKRWETDEACGLTGAVAAADGLNVLSSIFGRPEPGIHGYNANKATSEPLPFLDSTLYSNYKLITPSNCAARDFYPSYDYAGYLPIVERAGRSTTDSWPTKCSPIRPAGSSARIRTRTASAT